MRLNNHSSSLVFWLAFAAAVLPGFALAGPFQNGSFENGLNPPTSSYRSLFAGNADIDGWLVASGRTDWSGAIYLPKGGLLSAQLVGDGSAISQTFDTAVGENYNVSFSLKPNASVTTPVTIDVTLGGSIYHAVIPIGPSGTWYDYSTTLSASSTSSSLVFSNVDAGHNGPFLDEVQVTSASTNSPPTILTQPQSQTNTVGSTVAFSVLAGGTAPLTYQWLSNSLPLADGGRVNGANSNQLTIASLQLSDSGGNYSVIVSNDFDSVLSSNAVLVVTTNITWTGAVSGDWNNPANWNPQQIPIATDHVIINSGSVTISTSADFAIMDWNGGTISGPLTVADGAMMNWTGGTIGYPISGSLTVASNAVLNLSGSASKYLYCPLTNAGTVNWADGNLYVAPCYGGNQIVNRAGALFDIQCDQGLTYNPCSGPASFENAGTVRKSASTGMTTIYIPFSNSGTVAALQGTLNFNGGYSAGSSANLAISLVGAAPGSGYGKINFSTPLSFDGTFSVNTRNGYLPNPGDSFSVLSYPASTNSFTCLSGLDLGGGLLLQPHYNATGLTLTTTTYTTGSSQPELFISRSANGFVVQWPLGFPGWVLQSNTNLASSFWSPVPVVCNNQVLLPATAPSQFFRLKQ